MKERDWYKVSMQNDPHEVEWSPEEGKKNVRIKDKEGNWVYADAHRADEAYPRACQSLSEKELNEKEKERKLE